MSGHVGDLSPSQETALAAFREAVADITNKPEDNDYYYLRWLRARKFDLNKALEMFRNVCIIIIYACSSQPLCLRLSMLY